MDHSISKFNSESPFEKIRHVDEQNNEYWLARELMPLLGYQSWKRIKDTVERAEISCQNSGTDSTNHFDKVVQMTQIGDSSAHREVVQDYKLSRLACYLVAMNGDPRKPEIAIAQAYFVVKTREAEIMQQRPKTNAEMLLEMAQQFLEVERKQQALEAKLILEAQRTDDLEQLVHQHDGELDRIFNPDGNYYSIRGYAKLKGFNVNIEMAKELGKKAARLSNKLGYKIDILPDPRYGKVNVYSHYVLEQIFD